MVHSNGSLSQVFGYWLKRDTWDTFISSSSSMSSSSSTSSASTEVSDVTFKGFPLQTSCNCPKISEIPECDRGQSWDNFVAKEQAVFRATQPMSILSQSASSCKAFGSSADSSGLMVWTCNQAVWSHCEPSLHDDTFGHNASKKHWKAQNAMPRPWRSTRSVSTECWSGTSTLRFAKSWMVHVQLMWAWILQDFFCSYQHVFACQYICLWNRKFCPNTHVFAHCVSCVVVRAYQCLCVKTIYNLRSKQVQNLFKTIPTSHRHLVMWQSSSWQFKALQNVLGITGF